MSERIWHPLEVRAVVAALDFLASTYPDAAEMDAFARAKALRNQLAALPTDESGWHRFDLDNEDARVAGKFAQAWRIRFARNGRPKEFETTMILAQLDARGDL